MPLTTVAQSRSIYYLCGSSVPLLLVAGGNRWRARFVHVRGPWSTRTTISVKNREAVLIAQTLARAYIAVIVIPAKASPREDCEVMMVSGGKLAMHRFRHSNNNCCYHYHYYNNNCYYYYHFIAPSGGHGGRLIIRTIFPPDVCLHRGWSHSRIAFQSSWTIDRRRRLLYKTNKKTNINLYTKIDHKCGYGDPTSIPAATTAGDSQSLPQQKKISVISRLNGILHR